MQFFPLQVPNETSTRQWPKGALTPTTTTTTTGNSGGQDLHQHQQQTTSSISRCATLYSKCIKIFYFFWSLVLQQRQAEDRRQRNQSGEDRRYGQWRKGGSERVRDFRSLVWSFVDIPSGQLSDSHHPNPNENGNQLPKQYYIVTTKVLQVQWNNNSDSWIPLGSDYLIPLSGRSTYQKIVVESSWLVGIQLTFDTDNWCISSFQ